MKKTVKILCVLLCVILVLCGTSCKKDASGVQSQTASSNVNVGIFAVDSEFDENDTTLTVRENPNGWKAVPLTTAEQIKAGLAGGEGGQVILSVATAPSDGKIAFMTTDVGGIYKSIDGGVNWFPVTDGMRSSGANAIVCDPFNAEHVCVVGTNSYVKDIEANGLYITKNGGSKWYVRVMARVGGHRDYRNSIAFDRTSYSASIKGCSTIYWARAGDAYNSTESEPFSALYKSTDGGDNWTVVNTSKFIGFSDIYVDPQNGYVYAASAYGLYRSKDGGKTFALIVSENVGTVAVVGNGKKTTKLYCATKGELFLSTDHGDTFKSVSKLSFLTNTPKFLTVSPLNENKMLIQDYDSHLQELYYSDNAGASWKKSDMGFSGNRRCKNGFITYMEKPRPSAWSATDENTVIAVGGDFMIRSTDGGKSFKWSNSGNNGSCTTRLLINRFNPKLMIASNQDYNGGYSVDGGKTWKYVNWQWTTWGGQTYGGYIFDEKNMFVCVRIDGKYYVSYTNDGGKTVNIIKSKQLRGTASFASPVNKNVAFIGDYRVELINTPSGPMLRDDSFRQMSGVVGVSDYDPGDNTLYGRGEQNGKIVVKSTDDGKTWTRVGKIGGEDGIVTVAYNQNANKLYILTVNKLYTMNPFNGRVSELKTLPPSDCTTWNSVGFRFKSMKIDHENPDIMYIGNGRGIYISEINIIASTDGGKTWKSLGTDEYKDEHGTMPVRSVDSITIDQTDGTVYVMGGCRGIWKHKGLRK